jgi:hypothetical protein
VTYDDALERALSLTGDPIALEDFLREVEQWRPRLEAAVRLSRSIAFETASIVPGPASTARVEQRMLEAISGHAAKRSRSWSTKLLGSLALLPRPRLVAAAAVAGLALALGTFFVPGISDNGTQPAQALVIEGAVAEVGLSTVTVNTDGVASSVLLEADTQVTDALGNTLDNTALSPGQNVVVTGRKVGDDFVVDSVAIKGRLFGTVNAVTPNNLSLTNKGNIYNVELTPETRYEGRLVPGAFVEVDVIQQADGHLVAKKVEVEEEDEEEDSEEGDHDDQSVAPTSSPSLPSGASGTQPSNTPVPANTPAGAGDDHEDGEEHDEDGPEAPEATEQPEDHSDEDAEDEEHEDSEHEEDEEGEEDH